MSGSTYGGGLQAIEILSTMVQMYSHTVAYKN